MNITKSEIAFFAIGVAVGFLISYATYYLAWKYCWWC